MDDGGSIFGEEKVKRERTGLGVVGGFKNRPARCCWPIELLMMKITTKSQIDIRQQEQKMPCC